MTTGSQPQLQPQPQPQVNQAPQAMPDFLQNVQEVAAPTGFAQQLESQTERVAKVEPRTPEQIQQLTQVDVAKMTPQANEFMARFKGLEVGSEDFQDQLMSVMAAGRRESANSLQISSELTKGNLVGEEDSPAAKALLELSSKFDELDPGKQGDLMRKNKLFGVIPLPGYSKLKTYLRKYRDSEATLRELANKLQTYEEDSKTRLVEMRRLRRQLWKNIEKMGNAIYLKGQLVDQMTDYIQEVALTDRTKASLLETEVLYLLQQDHNDMLSAQMLAFNAYETLGVLVKSEAEVGNACNRMSTYGMQALELGLLLAKVTHRQAETMEAVEASRDAVHSLLNSQGAMMKDHVAKVKKFSENPLFGVKELQEAMAKTRESAQEYDEFRRSALTVQRENRRTMEELNNKQFQRATIERSAGTEINRATQAANSGFEL